jgi:hypothetical protein
LSAGRILNGKIVKSWDLFDQSGRLQQLGVISSPEQSGK